MPIEKRYEMFMAGMLNSGILKMSKLRSSTIPEGAEEVGGKGRRRWAGWLGKEVGGVVGEGVERDEVWWWTR